MANAAERMFVAVHVLYRERERDGEPVPALRCSYAFPDALGVRHDCPALSQIRSFLRVGFIFYVGAI